MHNEQASTPKEAAQESGKYVKNRPLLRARGQAALDVLRQNPMVDASKIVAIGYCFGGTAALELARSGGDLAGVVSFHGGLTTPTPEDAKNIKGRILAIQGGDDPIDPPKNVEAFEKEMRDAKVDWQVIIIGGAVHSFTDPAVPSDDYNRQLIALLNQFLPGGLSDVSKAVAYSEEADKRSLVAMQQFFREIFDKP